MTPKKKCLGCEQGSKLVEKLQKDNESLKLANNTLHETNMILQASKKTLKEVRKKLSDRIENQTKEIELLLKQKDILRQQLHETVSEKESILTDYSKLISISNSLNSMQKEMSLTISKLMEA